MLKNMFNPDGTVANEFKQYVIEQKMRAEIEQAKYNNIIKVLSDIEPSPAKDLKFTASQETQERQFAPAFSPAKDEAAKRSA